MKPVRDSHRKVDGGNRAVCHRHRVEHHQVAGAARSVPAVGQQPTLSFNGPVRDEVELGEADVDGKEFDELDDVLAFGFVLEHAAINNCVASERMVLDRG